MPKNTIFTDKEVRFLKALAKFNVKFMIVGLSAAALQGAPVVTQDIDLWFQNLNDPNLKKALRKVDATLIQPVGLNPPMFMGSSTKLFDIVLTMHGLKDFKTEWKNTAECSLRGAKVKVLKLDRIIKSKKAVGRDKDKLTIPVLEDALAIIADIRKKPKA